MLLFVNYNFQNIFNNNIILNGTNLFHKNTLKIIETKKIKPISSERFSTIADRKRFKCKI